MKLLLTTLLFILIYNGAFAQGDYTGSPCNGTVGDTRLKALLQKKEMKEFHISTCFLGSASATSQLKASGKAPISIKDPNFKRPDDFEEWQEGDVIYDSWTCMYEANAAMDNNKATAWVEGMAGNGKGELLLLPELDVSKKIEILSGFGKSDALFKANNRPKNIGLHILRAKPVYAGMAECHTAYEGMVLVASSKVTLKDLNTYQPLVSPSYKKETYQHESQIMEYEYWLMIELIDVYPGSKYQDTCISEIRNVK